MAGQDLDIIGGTAGAAQGAAAGTAILPGIGTALGALLGGVGSMFGAFKSGDEADHLMRLQLQHSAKMAATAHRREVNDLYAAGLNPVLTATGGPGASVGTGASYPNVPDVGGAAVSGAVQAARAVNELKTAVAARKNIEQDTKTKEAVEATNRSLSNKQDIEASNAGVQGRILKEQLQVQQSAAAAARTEEQIEESTLGRALRWVNRFSSAIQGGGSALDASRRGFGYGLRRPED